MAVRGDIFHHKSFIFHNGHVKNKYVVLLNTPSKSERYLFVKTTSQQHYNPTKPGCIKDRSLFFIPKGTTFFKKDTWVQLFGIYPIPPTDIDKSPDITFEGTLDHGTIQRVIDCLFLAEKDNISDEYQKMLRPPLETSLQKLKEKFGRKH